MATDEQEQNERESRSSVLMEVSNTMVRLYKDLFGRGPTAARTNWAGDNTLVVELEGTLTRSERHLVRMGKSDRLRDTRTFFQYATVRDFCEPVEAITGRKVHSFLSGIDAEVDGYSCEMFVLHPVGYDGPSRIDLVAP